MLKISNSTTIENVASNTGSVKGDGFFLLIFVAMMKLAIVATIPNIPMKNLPTSLRLSLSLQALTYSGSYTHPHGSTNKQNNDKQRAFPRESGEIITNTDSRRNKQQCQVIN